MAFRSQWNDVIISANGTGKTTFEIEIARDYISHNLRKRNLWLVTDNSEKLLKNIPEIGVSQLHSFLGIAKLVVEDQSIFDSFLSLFKDEDYKFHGLVICDDIGEILTARPKPVLDIKRKRRQFNLDLLWCFHGLHCDVPKGFFTWINRIYLGYTSDAHEDFLKKLPLNKRDLFMDVYNRVQKRGEKIFNYREEIIINPVKSY